MTMTPMPITKRKPSINQLFGCSLYANHIYPSFSVKSLEMASEFTLDWHLTLGTVFSTYSTTGFTTCRITCRFSTWSTGTLDVSGDNFRWDFFMILDNFLVDFRFLLIDTNKIKQTPPPSARFSGRPGVWIISRDWWALLSLNGMIWVWKLGIY